MTRMDIVLECHILLNASIRMLEYEYPFSSATLLNASIRMPHLASIVAPFTSSLSFYKCSTSLSQICYHSTSELSWF